MKLSLKYSLLLTYFTFLLLATQSAFALEPAFEAYSKVFLGGQHAGYYVQQFVIDSKKDELTSKYYIYLVVGPETTVESLVAKAKNDLEPLSYQYTLARGKETRTIDATFKNKKMTGTMLWGKKKLNVTLTVPQDGFLSTFLNYVIIKNGLAKGKNYSFTALGEESPACFAGDSSCEPQKSGFLKGSALVKDEVKFKGVDAYKLAINFKGIPFDGYINSTGDTLSTDSPLQNLRTEIVATRAEAVGGFKFNEGHIKAVFGTVPVGKKNALYVTENKAAPMVGSPTTLRTSDQDSTEGIQKKKDQ